MKNGYTPKQFAYSLTMEYISLMYKGRLSDIEDADITDSDKKKVQEHLYNLYYEMSEKAKLEGNIGIPYS